MMFFCATLSVTCNVVQTLWTQKTKFWYILQINSTTFCFIFIWFLIFGCLFIFWLFLAWLIWTILVHFQGVPPGSRSSSWSASLSWFLARRLRGLCFWLKSPCLGHWTNWGNIHRWTWCAALDKGYTHWWPSTSRVDTRLRDRRVRCRLTSSISIRMRKVPIASCIRCRVGKVRKAWANSTLLRSNLNVQLLHRVDQNSVICQWQ